MRKDYLAQNMFITSKIVTIVFSIISILIGLGGIYYFGISFLFKTEPINRYADVYFLLSIYIFVRGLFFMLSVFNLKIKNWRYVNLVRGIFYAVIAIIVIVRILF